jgi:hypothetical protein
MRRVQRGHHGPPCLPRICRISSSRTTNSGIGWHESSGTGSINRLNTRFQISERSIGIRDGIGGCWSTTHYRGLFASSYSTMRSHQGVPIVCLRFSMASCGTGPAPHATRGVRTASSKKPVYTREQIGELYELHRKGAYAGREAEWARQEADIFAAQREGRVQGHPYLTK